MIGNHPGLEAGNLPRLKTGVIYGAGNETRTRDIHVGNVTLYQLSYSRKNQSLPDVAVSPLTQVAGTDSSPSPLHGRIITPCRKMSSPVTSANSLTYCFSMYSLSFGQALARYWHMETRVSPAAMYNSASPVSYTGMP